MAKNKSSKFGVADNLQYRDGFREQPDFNMKKFLDHISNMESSDQPSVDSENNLQKSANNKKSPKRAGAYRFSLYMDPDLGEYLNYLKFKQRKSITDLFNDIVREKMENDISWQNLKE